MSHRIKIDSMKNYQHPGWRWYVSCSCGWEPRAELDSVTKFYGRPHWDAAFALGLAHLRQECKHV